MLREAIQIKAHTAPLTLSELVSKRGNGLMQRAVETARTHPECRVRLLSFGPFGQELQLVETRRDALQIAATLSGHARAVGAPLTIYLDVRPGDLAWTDLVQELARLPQIRVLVSIREEDWRRATLSGAAVAFEEIALTPEEPEAREIYRRLCRPGVSTPFLSFEDAWRRFVGSAGADGPLMEVDRLDHGHQRQGMAGHPGS